MGHHAARAAAEAVAPAMGWDRARVEAEVREYQRYLEHFHGLRPDHPAPAVRPKG